MIPMNIKEGEKLLLEIKKIMDELNVVFFLRHGTCLGAVRDGKLIEWDDDIDIGSILGMNNLDEQCIYKTVDTLKLHGFDAEVSESSFHIAVSLSKSNIPIDWTCYKVIDDSIYQYPAIKIPVNIYKNLKSIRLLGSMFSVPNPAETYLTLKYGPNWSTPKKNDYQDDIINSVPESVLADQFSILTKIRKFFFPSNYIAKIRILSSDEKPVQKAKVTIVGLKTAITNKDGYAEFDLLSKDWYAVVIENGNKKEILYEEILQPGLKYDYLPSKSKSSGRTFVLKEKK
tara:strand:- start:3 stop:860 length:858 start_codon:yes stop_codon:yes gene_type:complete